MTAKAIIVEIKPLGQAGYKKILLKHGAREPCFGVKIEELKKIQKRIKCDYQLALDLYDTGIYDAQYLAGLIADDARMTRADLDRWVQKACEPLATSTVAWVAAGSPHAWDVAREWIDSEQEIVAAAGWATWITLISITPDADLDLKELERLLKRVQKTIHSAPNQIRERMNWFVVALGSFVAPLSEKASAVGEKIGPVTVDVGDTACAVPYAPDYIKKVAQRGSIGKKRKSAKC